MRLRGRISNCPIHLLWERVSPRDMGLPDLAITLRPMDGYYMGYTCLTLQMAYQNTRLLARPTAP
ncbi:MAG: DUF3825 domain-containing protein [Clostridiales bacterium]|nr:DUF3825 domain-containing protein [Clostridiales bacterium]